MPDFIDDAAVALSLMLEALRLLDGPEGDRSAAHLRRAINELSVRQQRETSQSTGVADLAECADATGFVSLLQ